MSSNPVVGRRSLLVGVATVVTVPLNGGTHTERGASEPGTSRVSSDGPSVTPDGRYPATVDRIVDDAHVVLLVRAREEVVAQYDVTRTALPRVHEGDRVIVTVSDATLTAVHTDTGTRREVGRVRPTAATW